jgi:hypothetical protein
MSKYRQHPFVSHAKRNARIESGVDFLLVVLIAIGIAAALIAWWSA